VLPDMDRWSNVEMNGPITVTELNGLDPHTVYAVRVRARGADGRYGNFSDVVVMNRLESGQGLIRIFIYIFI
jgi:hypothetical protein